MKGESESMKTSLLIYNPNAGSGNITRYIDLAIEQGQKNGYLVIPFRIDSSEELDRFLSNVQDMEIHRTIIAGGDGTIHRILNKLYQYNIRCEIGVLAVGTANDFAYHLELPKNIEDMIAIAYGNDLITCDVGKANEEYFINVASLGFLIDISHRTNQVLKNNIGVLAYYIKGIEELPRLKPIKISIHSNEMVLTDEEIYFMLIMNGKSAGGFKKISPTSMINDGFLDIIIFKKTTLIDVVPLMINLVNGEHIANPNILHFQTKKISIKCDEGEVGTDLDGEIGPDFPINIEIIEQELKVCTQMKKIKTEF